MVDEEPPMSEKDTVAPPIVIAEIGCNHLGEMDIARKMIRIAKEFCEVDYVKFQKRTIREVLSATQYDAPHPEPRNSYGASYGEHREYLELSLEQHADLLQFCNDLGVGYSCSVWDTTSLREIMELKPDYVKIPSAVNTHSRLLEMVSVDYPGQIHVSLGMTSPQEERALIDVFESHDRLGDVVLYACTSGYPVPPEDICLLEIRRLEDQYGDRVGGIGFSGHYTGIGLDGPAYALGANYIERHFTLDRAWKGTDHAASLEPEGMRRVRKDTRSVAAAMRYKPEPILDIEKPQREKLKYRSEPE